MEDNKPGFLYRNKCLLIISAISFLIIYISSFVKGYGFFIDEFYYIACANRPAMGYVDHPPLAPLLLTVFQFIFGSSIYAVRFLPALAASASGFMTGIITREIKGGTFAQCLAAAAFSASPIIITFGGFYSMNPFEPLLAAKVARQSGASS
jgi:4-amino-4-deoxy-L-arabinose transferase-like glycosyltransferase